MSEKLYKKKKGWTCSPKEELTMAELKTFRMDSVCYGRGVRRIANCAYEQKDTSEKYVSKKNKGTSTGQKLSVLSNKIVEALFAAEGYGYNIFHGKKGKDDYFLGCFDSGQVKGPNYVGVIVKNGKYVKAGCTNIFSHNLYVVMMAMLAYFQDKEFLTKRSSLDLSNGFIDTNQEEPLYVINDCVYWYTKSLFEGTTPLNKQEAEAELQSFLEDFPEVMTENITAVLNEDNVAICSAALKLGVDKDIDGYTPPEIVLPKTMAQRQEEIKKDVLAKKYLKFKTEASIVKAGFPNDLIIRWKSGQEAFVKNAKNLSLESFGLVKSLSRQSVACLTGEAGGGKTTIAQTIAGCLGLPLVTVNGNADTDFASMILDYAAKDGETYAVLKPALLAYVHGGVVVIDEISRIKGEMSTALNAMLDKRDYYDAPNGVQYKKSKDFKVICTMNQGAGYTTEELDTSLIDRFNKIMFVPDPEKGLAVNIIADATGFKNKEIIGKMWDIKSMIDAKAREVEAISRTSLRGVIDWIDEAYVTGELVESAITTIIGKLMLKDEFISSGDKNYLLNECDNELVTFALESVISDLEDIEITEEDFA